MKVRRAVAADSPAVAAVVRAVYDEFGFTWDEDGYHADLADVEAFYAAFYVAEMDSRIVGAAGLTGHGSLERLYVLPEARGSGAGSALLTAVADQARRNGHVRKGAFFLGQRSRSSPHSWLESGSSCTRSPTTRAP